MALLTDAGRRSDGGLKAAKTPLVSPVPAQTSLMSPLPAQTSLMSPVPANTSLVSPVPALLSGGGGEEGKHHHQPGRGCSKSMSSFPDYVSKFRNKMVEIRTSFRATARMGLYNQFWIPPDLTPNSSSTHTTPLSQRVYGSGDGAGSSPHPGSSQEAVVGSGEVGGWDSRNNELQKLRELHGNGARPLSRNTNHRKDLKAPYESFHEELRPLGGGLVGTKLPPNALKNHPMLRAEPCLAQRSTHGPQSGPEEDVVAMGSLWNSNHQLQTRGSSTVISTTTTTILTSSASSSSTKSISTSFGNGSGSGSTFTSISGSLPSRRPTLGATFTCHSSSLTAPSMGNIVKSNKERELEPKYCDPVPGAPPSFQQRLMELAALEAETVRWERSKKVKKKPLKQDKDS